MPTIRARVNRFSLPTDGGTLRNLGRLRPSRREAKFVNRVLLHIRQGSQRATVNPGIASPAPPRSTARTGDRLAIVSRSTERRLLRRRVYERTVIDHEGPLGRPDQPPAHGGSCWLGGDAEELFDPVDAGFGGWRVMSPGCRGWSCRLGVRGGSWLGRLRCHLESGVSSSTVEPSGSSACSGWRRWGSRTGGRWGTLRMIGEGGRRRALPLRRLAVTCVTLPPLVDARRPDHRSSRASRVLGRPLTRGRT